MRNGISLFLLCLTVSYPLLAQATECVILLHGLARTHVCMWKLEKRLRQHHYIVINRDYPTTKKSMETLANFYLPSMINSCLKYNVKHIHFVTHSMGGLVLQKYLRTHTIPKLDRIVMLSPPNHGSPIADLLHEMWIYQILMGPAGQELMTTETSISNRLHLKPQYQIGIIAGTFNFVPFGNLIFHEANDGAVSVSSAKMNIMKDFIALNVSHSFMMDNALVQNQIIHFLQDGRFIH